MFDSARIHVLVYVGFLVLYPSTQRKKGMVTHSLNPALLLKRFMKASLGYEVQLSLLQWGQCLELLRLALSYSLNLVHELWTSWVCKAKAGIPRRICFHARLSTPSFQASLDCIGVAVSCGIGLTCIHQGVWEHPLIISCKKSPVRSCEVTETMRFLFLPLYYPCSVHMILFGSEKTAGTWEGELIFSKHHQKHVHLASLLHEENSWPGWENILCKMASLSMPFLIKPPRSVFSAHKKKPRKYVIIGAICSQPGLGGRVLSALQGLCSSAMPALLGGPSCAQLTR